MRYDIDRLLPRQKMRRTKPYFLHLQTLTYRVRNRLRREISLRLEKLVANRNATYNLTNQGEDIHFSRRFSFLDVGFLSSLRERAPGLTGLILEQAETSLAHTFDLLGSGSVVVAHGIQCRGLDGTLYPPSAPVEVDGKGGWLSGRINRFNLKESQRIWQLVGPGYVPIDWQLDFKSGYRWREDAWHRDIRFGQLPGVDVKVPWELGRLQHLPTLALACHFARVNAPDFQDATLYEQEFRDQVLDFIATNPPGFGVNWACAMDVGIRCANLLVARDIVVASGAQFDEAFEGAFAASIVAHSRHIIKNLEWAPVYRGNHYLANVVGLLFAAVYLPASREVNSWLAFAAQEFLSEVAYQFHEDGSNFEASVCYHRLSAEMVMWGCALLANLPEEKLSVLTRPHRHSMRKLPRLNPKPWLLHPIPNSDRVSPVPAWCWERLKKMADFTQAMTRPDGVVVQFGDNDSGRFIVLCSGEQLRAANDPSAIAWSLDHRALIASIRTLLGMAETAPAIDDPSASILRGFAGLDDVCPQSSQRDIGLTAIGDERTWIDCLAKYELAPIESRSVDNFLARPQGLVDSVQREAFPGMGCYVFRSDRLFLAVRCGELGVAGLGAHAHCDQLSIELVIDGEDCVRDPGTYLYTPFPQERNAYRSAMAHHVPHVKGREPANLSLGLFDLRGAAEGECLYFGPRGFIGRHFGYGAWVYRIVFLESGGVKVYDFAEGGLELTGSRPESMPFSPSYGRLIEHTATPYS